MKIMKNYTKLSKKESLVVYNTCTELLVQNGFVRTKDNERYEYSREVNGGRLDCRLDHGYSKTFGWCVDFYSMHSNPDKAIQYGIECNPYSGKYNWYIHN